MDVSHITGESKPIQVKEGAKISNGSLNLNSTLRLKVEIKKDTPEEKK